MLPIKLNIQGKKLILDYNQHFAYLAEINEALNLGAAQNYKQMGLLYVDVPEIVGITGACENVDTLFKVQNRLDLPLFFTQTGQLSLEQALQSFPGVYTVIHSGRDEDGEDERHLRQFRLTEEEFDCTLLGMNRANYNEEKMFVALLNHVQKTIQAMVKNVLAKYGKTLKTIYKRDLDRLGQATTGDFWRINYEKAVRLLNKNGYPQVKFGDDLKAEHEAKIVQLLNKHNEELPVFITKYPKEIKFFNMKVSTQDSRVVLSADLIFPYAGEGTGSAVREHDFDKLNERLITSKMFELHVKRGGKYEDFSWYLNIMKQEKTNPHAGYGIGNERVLQYIFGERDIRNVSMFSQLGKQSGDWHDKHYGQAAIVASAKKHLLVSIGKKKDKEHLLTYIKKLANKNNFTIYATKKTHNFLKAKGILSLLVYKISEIDKSPNIADLLKRRVFDIIINIPRRIKVTSSNEFTDGKLIRKGAIEIGTYLITDVEVAKMVIETLINKRA